MWAVRWSCLVPGAASTSSPTPPVPSPTSCSAPCPNGYPGCMSKRIKTSKIQKEHYKNHPERRLNHSKFMNEYWKKSNRNPSEEMLEYCKTHPEKQLKQSISMKKHYESSEARELTSRLAKEYYEDPNHRKRGKEYMRCRFTKVDQYTKDMKFIKTFDCVQEAADEVGVTAPNIFQCIYGKGKTSAGFIWKKHEAK